MTTDKNPKTVAEAGARIAKTAAKRAAAKPRPVSRRNSPPPPAVVSEIHLIPLERIEVAPQVRTEFDEASIRELADDIEARGLLQPVLVNPIGDEKYRLVCGERRMRAIRLLGHNAVPAVITKMADRDARLAQLAENIQREDLSLDDRCNAVKWLHDELGSVTAVAETIKRSKAWVSKLLALTMPEFSQRARDLLANGHTEDLEILGMVNQAELIGWDVARDFTDAIIKGMTRQEARDWLKNAKEKKRKATAETQQSLLPPVAPVADSAKSKEKKKPVFIELYEARYGIWKACSDEDMPSPAAILAQYKPHEQTLIEQLIEPAWFAGTECMGDAFNAILEAAIDRDRNSPLYLAAFVQGVMGNHHNLLDTITRLWNCDPDNQKRRMK